MKFTLAQLAAAVALVSIALAFWALQKRIAGLEERNHRLRKLVGYVDERHNYIALTTLQPHFDRAVGTHILRIGANEGHCVEITSFDGATGQANSTSVPLSEPLVAITMTPGSDAASFYVQSTLFDARVFGRLDVSTNGWSVQHYRPTHSTNGHVGGLALVYWFTPEKRPLSDEQMDVGGPYAIRAICRETGALAVFFRIVNP